jgi:hypothetical protein
MLIFVERWKVDADESSDAGEVSHGRATAGPRTQKNREPRKKILC